MSFTTQLMPIIGLIGKKIGKDVYNRTNDPLKYETELLMKLIEENKDTVYGKEHHFDEIKSIEDYQRNVALNEYDNFYPYIERIAKGEKNILTSKEVVHLNKTSGTLGCEKMIPLIEDQVSVFGKYNALYLNGIIYKDIGPRALTGKGFSLTEGTFEILDSGIPYGCASSVMAARMAQKGKVKGFSSDLYTSPIEASQPKSGTLTRYIHARFALSEKNVSYGISTFSSNFLEVIRYIEKNWKLLVNDIKTGTIDESINLDDDVRKSLLTKIKPMKKRAKELERIFSQGFDEPYVPKVWPRFSYLIAACGANFSAYTEKLHKFYFGDKIKFLYLGLSASEGYISVPINVNKEDSLLITDCCFMEFINTDQNKSQDPVTIDKLEVNNCYEIIITNLSGLYRYRIHDVIRVTGMFNNTPLCVFENRAGYAVNIFGEKTSEKALLQTIKKTEEILGLDIIDYSVYPDCDNTPSRYVFLLELKCLPENVSKEDIRRTLEEQIQIANPDIEEEFTEKHLDHVRLVLLQSETYLLYRDLMVMKGASAQQLKPVNIIRNEFQRKFFFGLEDKEL